MEGGRVSARIAEMADALVLLLILVTFWLFGFARGAEAQKDRDGAKWYRLRETVKELRDNGGKGTQKELMTFIYKYMANLESEVEK